MSSFKAQLEKHVEGEVRFDPSSRRIYAVDASIIELLPTCIVIPKNIEALQTALLIAKEHGVAVTARGAATGTAGGCLGQGMILDTSQYLNQILEVNWEEEHCTVQPGVVQDDLNELLATKGFRLGPNTSTGNRSTIGGMFATNAAGSHSLHYGQMRSHVLQTTLAKAGGILETFSPLTIEEWEKSASGSTLQKLWNLRERNYKKIVEHFPKIQRRASGYNLDALLAEKTFNPCELLVGSEGTFGIATELKLKIVRPLENGITTLLFFSNMLDAMRAVPELLEFGPTALEMIDRDIIEGGKVSPTLKSRLSWLEGSPECLLVLELPSDHPIPKFKSCYAVKTLENTKDLWAVRKAGLELLLSRRKWQRALAFIEDLAVPAQTLPRFMEEFVKLLNAHGKRAGIYGHVGESCLHIRPYIDLSSSDERQTMIALMEGSLNLVQKYGGVLSGEHGDGIVRSWLNPKLFGEDIYALFKDVKEIFDPSNLMNPGKIVDPISFEQHLRMTTRPKEPETFQDFSLEGGLALAADLCNGNGLCRKKEGVMCPSFQATRSEYDSTRARAQVLRGIIRSDGDLSDLDLHDVLDLCLACKGCKKECPSQVDVTKMKQEALYHYHKLHGTPLRTRLFAHLALVSSLSSKLPKTSAFFAKLLKPLVGIASKRSLPKTTNERFSKRFKTEEHSKEVVLYNDTYSEFYDPEVGEKAVQVLNALGYKVHLPKWSCCGKPLLSKGHLEEGKKALEKVFQTLTPFAEAGLPIIGLEPSCLLTLKEDALSFGLDIAVIEKCITFDEFLFDHKEQFPFNEKPINIALHGHCHHKSSVGMEKTLAFLKMHPKANVELIETGCCGMAGAFGYEKEHYDLSVKIANLTLIPYLEKCTPETLVIASGFSCRTQIHDLTEKRAYHLAEAAYSLMRL